MHHFSVVFYQSIKTMEEVKVNVTQTTSNVIYKCHQYSRYGGPRKNWQCWQCQNRRKNGCKATLKTVFGGSASRAAGF